MGKTGFEKFAEKNSAMSELDIKIGKKADTGTGERGRGVRPEPVSGKAPLKKLLVIPADLAVRLEEIKKETYRMTLTSVILEALSEYVSNYDRRRA